MWRCSRTHGVVVASFAIVFASHYIVHARISLDVDLELYVVFVRLKEGMFSAQCSMKKVAEGC